jgi:hypothetical protein
MWIVRGLEIGLLPWAPGEEEGRQASVHPFGIFEKKKEN